MVCGLRTFRSDHRLWLPVGVWTVLALAQAL
jgi:hypothetical protein